MRLIHEKLGEHAAITGYIHEPSMEMENVRSYPLMLVFPGGGFRICSAREAEPVAMAYFAKGYNAFVLDYTTVTKKPDATFDDPLNDAAAAWDWLNEHADELYLDMKKSVICGFSGGGHLAAASVTHGAAKPAATVLGYPGIVASAHRALNCPDIPESVTQDTPPAFMFGTSNDSVTPPIHMLTYATALSKAGVEFELHIFGKGEHGSSLANAFTSSGNAEFVNPALAEWFPMSVRWLEDKLGDFTIYGINDGRTGKYSIDTPVGKLMENAAVKQIIEKELPMLVKAASNEMAAKMSIRKMAGYLPGMDAAKLDALNKVLLTMN